MDQKRLFDEAHSGIISVHLREVTCFMASWSTTTSDPKGEPTLLLDAKVVSPVPPKMLVNVKPYMFLVTLGVQL